MAEDPKPKIVRPEGEPEERNPASIFNDLASLRKASKLTVQRKTVLINVGVDRPPNNVHFRAHPEWAMDDSTVLQDRAERVFYFVAPTMRQHPKLAPRLRSVTLAVVCLWPGGEPLIWPVPVVGDRSIPAWKSARKAYELSHEHWMQIVWDGSDYKVEAAEGINVEPTWPDKTFNELLKLGFDGKIIDNEEHPYVRRLRGLDS
jgi:hypothetical protein